MGDRVQVSERRECQSGVKLMRLSDCSKASIRTECDHRNSQYHDDPIDLFVDFFVRQYIALASDGCEGWRNRRLSGRKTARSPQLPVGRSGRSAHEKEEEVVFRAR
jgi:hypothetical protein